MITETSRLDAPSLADIATLGFAISFMTSASVALADCFLLFFLPVVLCESFINK